MRRNDIRNRHIRFYNVVHRFRRNQLRKTTQLDFLFSAALSRHTERIIRFKNQPTDIRAARAFVSTDVYSIHYQPADNCGNVVFNLERIKGKKQNEII